MMKFVTSSVGIGLSELLMTDYVKPVWRNLVVFQIFTKHAGIHQVAAPSGFGHFSTARQLR